MSTQTAAVFTEPQPRASNHADPVYLIFDALSTALRELDGREDDTDYWLTSDEVQERRETLTALVDAAGPAHTIVMIP